MSSSGLLTFEGNGSFLRLVLVGVKFTLAGSDEISFRQRIVSVFPAH